MTAESRYLLLLPLFKIASWVTRRLPSFPGRWRIVRHLQEHHRWLARLGPITVRTPAGHRLEIWPDNNFDAYIGGLDFADNVGLWLARILRPGDYVLDIGANIGYTVLVALSKVGGRGFVHAFEASPRVVANLRCNIALNQCTNVRIHAYAVSNQCGQVFFYLPSQARSALSSMRDLGETAERIAVPSLTIDSIISTLLPVNLVKIDTEGAEFLVLQGMQQLLARDHPVLILELTDRWLRTLGGDARQVCTFLEDRGYSLYRITPDRAEPLLAPPHQQIDLLGIPSGWLKTRSIEGLSVGQSL